jgi:hypothetical protein
MKRKLLILATLVFLGLIAYLIFWGRGAEVEQVPPGGTGELPPVVIPPVPATSTLPTGDRLSIGTPSGVVRVKNFYNNALDRDETMVTISKTKNYSILYFPRDSGFIVSVLSSPFEEGRMVAEQEFLRSLDISQEDACKLKVEVTTIYTINPDFAGRSLGLSFCQSGIQ